MEITCGYGDGQARQEIRLGGGEKGRHLSHVCGLATREAGDQERGSSSGVSLSTPGGTRTRNLGLRRASLFHLSYWGV